MSRRSRESRIRVHGGRREYHLRHRYGIGEADYDEMLQAQSGRCAICARDLGDKPHVDHDHVTGEVRALLCFNCNGGLGQFGDDADRLASAVAYLRWYAPTASVIENRMRRLVPFPRRDTLDVHDLHLHDAGAGPRQ